MGFFAELDAWLNGILTGYIGDSTTAVAAALEPAVITLAAVYMMFWGYLQLSGQIQEPLLDGLKRIARLVIVIGLGLHLWLYNSLIVDTFFNAPMELAAAISGSPNAVSVVDQIISSGADTAGALIQKGGVLDGNFSYYLAGFFVYIAVGLAAVYTIFLLCLARIALSVLLALGPLFLCALLFRGSTRLFDAWISQLINYGLIAVLATLVTTLLMHLLTTVAAQTAALGTGIQIVDAVRVCFASALMFLLMRQIMPIAAGLAGGSSLTTFGAFSRSIQWLGARVQSI
jgi:type IV secretion system protein VirB6